MFQSFALPGTSWFTRLICPLAVNTTKVELLSARFMRAKGFSSLGKVRNSFIAPPPAAVKLALSGSAGNPITASLNTRPALVTNPISPRADDLTTERIESWLTRFLASSSGAREVVRASNPLEDIITKQGSSSISIELEDAAETISSSEIKSLRRSSP